jgi:putative toxin-antitoxin system antitoxin component (TIGR02293 family)
MAIAAAERAAEYLGIETKGSPLAWVHAAEKGLPVAKLESFAKRVAPDDTHFKYSIVSKATFARRKDAKPARLSKEESERLMRIVQTFSFAEEVWGGLDDAVRFMSSPHALLEGERPWDVVVGSEMGGRLVEEILGRLAYGSAA